MSSPSNKPEPSEGRPHAGIRESGSEEAPRDDAASSVPGEAEERRRMDDGAPAHETSGDETGPALSDQEVRGSVEALLYASHEPLTMRQLKKALPEAIPDAIRRALDELVRLYGENGRGLHIIEVAGGYQIATRPEYHERVSRLFESKPPPRLSIQALETLAAIAYRQPVTVPEIMELRGVRSAGVVRTLLEKKLIRIMGRKEVVGRPLLYGTTKEFLLRFGLKDLKELPRLEDMAEVFGDEVAGHLERLSDSDEEGTARESAPSKEAETAAPQAAKNSPPDVDDGEEKGGNETT